jgi:catechol 2,3-dioxygenase-like lactoylglutathione lyase family enzyme
MTLLCRVARNVADLAAATFFYEALGFEPCGQAANDPELALVLGVEQAISLHLALGAQFLELTQCAPHGEPYPRDAKSDDLVFQHIAIVTRDIFEMQNHALNAGATLISCDGPQQLAKEAGGAIAWKFRDPEGHPLEFLQPPGDAFGCGPLTSGYDHSAICVADIARSVHFYSAFGLSFQHRHLNQGVTQARLDGLATSTVEVVALVAAHAPPHVELLGYQGVVPSHPIRPNDIVADRLVFSNSVHGLALRSDPDGHFLLLDGRD